jgi:cytochrome c peroxidase
MQLVIARYKRKLAVLSTCALASVLLAPSSWADKGFASLKTVVVPKPSNLALYVANETAAIQLGKALFWDMQTGGDGVTACASCHFQAGADNRTRNKINPHGDAFNSVTGANADLTASVFPITTNDVVGSAGVIKNLFAGLSGSPLDSATYDPDSVFNYNGFNIRQVTGRNAPSVINAVYNFRNFWDGRAREKEVLE